MKPETKSKELLRILNGNNQGKFHLYLEEINNDPSIAWYPSAGDDFRPLLYLSKNYAEYSKDRHQKECFPDIFLFTDYMPSPPEGFLDNETIFYDGHTKLTRSEIEFLPHLDLPLDNEIVESANPSLLYGRVYFFTVHISSDSLGEFEYPVIYAFVENESFCSKVLLPNKVKISHIIHVRYGGGCGGGGKATGIWMLNVLRRLKCQVFVTDGRYDCQDGDRAAYRLYPNLNGKPLFQIIRMVDSDDWSSHGDIGWYLI